MSKYTFSLKNFKVFEVPGLDARMQAIESDIRPKLRNLGEHFTDFLNTHTADEFFPHIAKHARRTVNPPKDTWIAFSTNKRGYKMLPHFQIGLYESQVFVMFGVMHEAKNKAQAIDVFEKHLSDIENLPEDYRICPDHVKMEKPLIKDLTTADLEETLARAKQLKKGEFFIARTLSPRSPELKSDRAFIEFLEATFEQLLKFYP
ncbi:MULTISPECIES: YktB family protein [Staphylococcus]|uniref:YktB family protein n=1 Tax=Staphylococcus TaxID=1279 RepID=UPI001E567324|nr:MULTISPECIES: DUF1054 domain-containing protein [Staphylococcus]MCD8914494.1 DUF1054 domain-containing protein [Staphylococcus simulans]UXV34267.1 DUF1054 domain-containing protein [Staphylococcus sp. IVB6181]